MSCIAICRWGAAGLVLLLALLPGHDKAASAQSFAAPACYDDGHGAQVCFPLGSLSFADEIVAFRIGDPPPVNEADRDPANFLGTPGTPEGSSGRSLTLGCGGVVTARFADNALVDLPGPDLHLFEVGPDEEVTRLEISKDGRDWRTVGRVWGGRAAVDIAWAASPGESFTYVRLTDLRYACGASKRWSGADLDAIGAIGSARRLSLDSAVLFDVDKAVLRPEGEAEIARVGEAISRYAATRVTIEGHTDSDGSDAHNLDLSERRAAAVREALDRIGALGAGLAVDTVGYGESRPTAPNDSAANKQKNRRVEILVVPSVASAAETPDASLIDNTRPGVHGEWTRGDHKLTLAVDEARSVVGTYTSDEGRIFGTVQDRVVEGYWVEKGSKVACDSEKDGSRHWGRLRMEFDPDFVRYKAQWSYCDEQSWRGSYDGRWTG